ncbi:MAG: methyltransferase domain-containing protein [Clostridia bacterium]|nr:methyltransferase domain-containing protein [Clostridia bacterium]
MEWWQAALRCPICEGAMHREERSLWCDGVRRHCFDLSAEGYVNLASARAAGGGDDAALIAARTAFLSAEHYAPLSDRVCALVSQHAPGGLVADAGCGEGYYTRNLAAHGLHVLGFDLSKRGIRSAARAARGQQNCLFAVAGIYTLPVADGTLDAVVSLFAPVAEQEFLRVLKPGGVLLTVGAGADHLFSLKRVLYDAPTRNEARADAPVAMTEVCRERLTYPMELTAKDAQNLFAMTPYFYRTSREGRERLDACTRLSCEADFEIALYRK